MAAQWPGWAGVHTASLSEPGRPGRPRPSLGSAFTGKGLRTAAPSPSVSRCGVNPRPLLWKVDS